MRLIIAGSRNFYDYNILKKEVTEFIISLIEYNHLEEGETITIVSGGATGADAMGKRYAKEFGYELEVKRADWDTHGNKAGMLRNIEMGDTSDACIVFNLNESKGSSHMAEYAYRKGLETRVINIYDKNL